MVQINLRTFAAGLVFFACCAGAQAAGAEAKAPATRPFQIVELRGTPEEIGKQHAEALGAPIRELQQKYFGRLFSNPIQKQLAIIAASGFVKFMPVEHRDELAALAKSAGVAESDLLLGNCFLDLSPITACSTITLPAGASPDGVARFGRNLDFPSLNIADKHSVLMIVHPKDRFAYAAVSWPGLIGVLSGMNEHGLTLANMEVNRPGGKASAMPYTLLYRTVLERCKSTQDAIDLINKTPRQTANNLMVMDSQGNRAVLEITPQNVTVRRADDRAALVSTNHQRGDDTQAGRCRRYDYLMATSAKNWSRIDAQGVQEMLAKAAQGNFTLQSMVFEPSTRTMWLATGANAARRTFHRIDFGKYFENTR